MKRTNRRRRGVDQSLWHDNSRNPLLMGCIPCPFLKVCGGISVGRGRFDCMQYCCGTPATCDAVCPATPSRFSWRVREINGFGLNNVRRFHSLGPSPLPEAIPMIYHGSRRQTSFAYDAVAISLYHLYDRRTGAVKFSSREEIADRFKFDPNTNLVLSGVAQDRSVENWWRVASDETLRSLKRLGIYIVTVPNFSVFTNRPRFDDLHSIKRIVLTWERFMSAGIQAALQVNARTDHDYVRLGNFISARPEVEYISFEFGTGAGWPDRLEWHVRNLCRLGKSVNHDLRLIIRGGLHAIPRLREAFSSVNVIETSSFTKTWSRQRASLSEGKLVWKASPSKPGEPLDELFESNVTYFRKYIRALNRVGREDSLCSLPAQHGNQESSEIRLLNDTSGF
jgi:hypothetical protein